MAAARDFFWRNLPWDLIFWVPYPVLATAILLAALSVYEAVRLQGVHRFTAEPWL